MRYILVVFNSRNDTLSFYNIIKNNVGFCSIINTPHSLSRSCGISVKIPTSAINLSRQIINNSRLSSFKGIYEINSQSSSNKATRIY